MTDIVERLLLRDVWKIGGTIFAEAANEIERLREQIKQGGMNAVALQENERLRKHYADEQQRLFHYERVMEKQRGEIERLCTLLRDVLNGIEWTEREGAYNGLKLQIEHALDTHS